MFKFDLKSGYHHIDIHPDHQIYPGFSWEFDYQIKYFVFTALPFGLSLAPYIFTKMLRPLVKRWRAQGNKFIVYLDDGFWLAKSYTLCEHMSTSVHSDLLKAGFLPNYEKSVWVPCQKLEWLGFIWNSVLGCLERQ